MRVALAILIAVSGTVGGAPAAPVPTHLMKPVPPYFPTAVGTTWVYENGDGDETQTITRAENVNGGVKVTVARAIGSGAPREEQVAVTERGVWMTCFDTLFTIPKPTFRTGDSWEWDVVATATFTSDGMETLKVPAGTFETERVVVVYDWGRGIKTRGAFWYAPGVGLVKTSTGSSSSVLKAFACAGE